MKHTHIYFRIALMVTLAIFMACGSTEKTEDAALRDEVMDIHDEVMPRINEVVTLKSKLTKHEESIKGDTSEVANGQRMMIEAAVYLLDQADKSMMDWMHQLDLEQAGKSEEEKLAYWTEEKGKVTIVKEMILSSIEKGEQILAKIQLDEGNAEAK